ncbi:hypothetical protein V2J09_015636 [Rumex salicifolius]
MRTRTRALRSLLRKRVSATSKALNTANAAPKLCPVTDLFPGGEPAIGARNIVVGVEANETRLDLDVRVGAWDFVGRDGLEDVHEIVEPVESRDGSPPCDHCVAAAKAARGIVVRYRRVAYPVCTVAPRLGPEWSLEEFGEVDV